MEPDEVLQRLARTEKRLQWYLLGLEEAKPGYRGLVFSLPHHDRERVGRRAHAVMRSLRNKGPRAGRGVDRTLSRLGWYMDGLRDAVPGYRGRIFALSHEERERHKARIKGALSKLDVPGAASAALRG